MPDRYIGIDIGAETIKVVELERKSRQLKWTQSWIREHHKNPKPCLLDILYGLKWNEIDGAAVSGRFSREVDLRRIPVKQAQATAYRFLHGLEPATVVNIGSHGFSALEIFNSGVERFRENTRCSQGTGNFLRQLVGRFKMTVEEASLLSENVNDPAQLSGRCPVILKTDMTHLANQGESRARIIAGLFDAICENVVTVLKPSVSPPRVILIGGVSRSPRIRTSLQRLLLKRDMALIVTDSHEGLFYEALGTGLIAAKQALKPPKLNRLFSQLQESHFEQIPALSNYVTQVRRMAAKALPALSKKNAAIVLGFDIGSTGSKAIALDIKRKEIIQEEYVATNGDPLGSAQILIKRFIERLMGQYRIMALGVTGSGREIVGSLMTSCYGPNYVFVMNEIAAHAEGALYYDRGVDTIFEIGGQDAKYIRLCDGHVVETAMNEACSAGTGSFIEEQGRKFADIDGVAALSKEALKASSGISLGQHCSVFMAEIIDECVAAGIDQRFIISGLFDSVIQNYLHRVKGNRSVGQTIFCQGMPFSSEALAAAVARQTGSQVIIPPNPGTVGAVGIALLSMKALSTDEWQSLDIKRLLEAQIVRKDRLVCKSVKGCGGSGNQCRIDRLITVNAGKQRTFTWGGGCSLYASVSNKRKLPDRSPDPFRESEELVAEIVEKVLKVRGRRRVAIANEFILKELFPFFATYFFELGFDLIVHSGSDRALFRRGSEQAKVSFCAPMQLFHGLTGVLAEEKPDILFLPMLRDFPGMNGEASGVVCPIGQGSPDILRLDLPKHLSDGIFSPVIDAGEDGLQSEEFEKSCREIALLLGFKSGRWRNAFEAAMRVQKKFDEQRNKIGEKALRFCKQNDIIPVVVLGRTYTIYNNILNSNVPAILREQGVIPIPIDCFPVDTNVPVFKDIYWGQAQRILRVAHQIRRQTGVYSVYCSNYSCGPDSFGIHFYSYIMEGKPFVVIETDGHAGDAGTKTRIEAFLFCVSEDMGTDTYSRDLQSFTRLQPDTTLSRIREREDTLLIPWFSELAEVLASCFRGIGIKAESLPVPNQETLNIGRRYTSGKECLPMCLTLGNFVQRINKDSEPDKRFALLLPTARGPCRFGVYNLLQKIILEKLGLKQRVTVWSPADSGYFTETEGGFAAVVLAGFMAIDMLIRALHDSRPVEKNQGAAVEIFTRFQHELMQNIEFQAAKKLTRAQTILEVLGGTLFGCADILGRAANCFNEIRNGKQLPNVLLVGEIYVRLDPFANGFIIDQLEQRGLRVVLVPGSEWFEYNALLNNEHRPLLDIGGWVSHRLQCEILAKSYAIMAKELGWPPRTTVTNVLSAARPYVRSDLRGEAALTVGGPVYEWRQRLIDGAVSVGPLECMPNKIAETQFVHVLQREGLPTITLPFNGNPVDPELLDNFAFEIHERFQQKKVNIDRIM